jgi:hypothetical protein
MSHVWKISLVQVVSVVFSVVFVQKSFPRLFFNHNHFFYRTSEFFAIPWFFFAKILKLPFGHDSVGKGFNHFSFGDVVYLGT